MFHFQGFGSPPPSKAFTGRPLSRAFLSPPPHTIPPPAPQEWEAVLWNSAFPRGSPFSTHHSKKKGPKALLPLERAGHPRQNILGQKTVKKEQRPQVRSPPQSTRKQGWVAHCKMRTNKTAHFNKVINVFERLPLCA